MSSQDVKYPNQPAYRATVAEEALIENSDAPQNGCAKCFMAAMSLVFVLLGLAMASLATYTLIVLTYGGQNVLYGYSLASVYTLLAIGLTLLVISIFVWVSSCKPTNACSKIVLVVFSVIMVVIFLVEITLIALTVLWIKDVQFNVSGVSVGSIFNETVSELFTICCTNSSLQAQDICSHVLEDQSADCSSFTFFFQQVVGFIAPLMQWVAIFLGVVAFFNLVAFICSCCLICSKKRTAYYKPATTYSNGGV
jgi:hypothetical protein